MSNRRGRPWHEVRATRENFAMRAMQRDDPSGVKITATCCYDCGGTPNPRIDDPGATVTSTSLEGASLKIRQHYYAKHGGQPEDR